MPTKEQVRKWMQDRQAQHTAPPSPEQIRRELGWGLQVIPKKQER